MHRRSFHKAAILATSALSLCRTATASTYLTSLAEARKFTIDLCPGRLGVSVGQDRAIELAGSHRFESVEPYAEHLARLNNEALAQTIEQLKQKKLKWGAAGLTVEFRKDQATFDSGMKDLPAIAKGLNRAGVDRVGTWLSPSSDELTYVTNFRQHAKRLSAIADVFNDQGIRFGLEYVGPKTLWASKRYAFIHTMDETLELIAETGKSNIGIVLDCWHWYTSGESLDTLKQLTNEQIIAVDLNDAPAGIERDQQIDSKRELPAATGVIDVKTFLQFLVDVGYDGPVRAEPFNKVLNDMEDEPAVDATSQAMYKAIALLDQRA